MLYKIADVSGRKARNNDLNPEVGWISTGLDSAHFGATVFAVYFSLHFVRGYSNLVPSGQRLGTQTDSQIKNIHNLHL